MFYLIWEMGILLLLAVGFGVFVGYQLWSGDARSAEADAAIAETARLRQENENLARRLGEAESQSRAAIAADTTPARDVAPEIVVSAPTMAEPMKAEPTKAEPTRAEPTIAEPVKTGALAKETAVGAKPAPKTKPTAKPAAAKTAAPKPAGTAKAAAKAKAPAAAEPVAAGHADLGVIKGLGPKAAAALKAGGVTSLAQIAGWTDADIERWDQAINGRGRIVRDDWVGQARKLAGKG
ncbi:hypothetical protein [Maricaulis sp.]|uniref:hypothetical protein n=1 Tax=Maricaulis sp. TaxID=1486257 RepID=UPI0025C579B1|nr:hypothetical protein [Maricaulis sp.]